MTTEAAGPNNGKALAASATTAEITPLGFNMHPIVQAILAQNPTIEAMERLWALQREWDADNARKAFTAALAQAKLEMPSTIEKDKTVDFVGKQSGIRTYYKHSSLGAVMDAATVPLARHGISLSWESSTEQNNVTVCCVLTHVGGYVKKFPPVTAPVDTSGNKSLGQGVMSTITLLSRYTAMAALGLASVDMEEEGDTPRDETTSESRPVTNEVIEDRKRFEEAQTAIAQARTDEELQKVGAGQCKKVKGKDLRDKLETQFLAQRKHLRTKIAQVNKVKGEPEHGQDDGDYGPPSDE